MSYKSVSYISKILWRFFGSSAPDNWEQGLKDIQFAFTEDGKISLAPYFGPSNEDRYYTRQVIYKDDEEFDNIRAVAGGVPEDEDSLIYAKEHKAVCFCDIPLNHIPLHMKKYNCVGLGIDRDLLIKKSMDLQPVRYHFIKNKEEFYQNQDGLFKSEDESGDRIVSLEKYIKVPTLFEGDYSVSYDTKPVQDYDLSEGFNSIYEEREWRLFNEVTLELEEISFLLLPSRDSLNGDLGHLEKLFDKKVGVIFADQLFHEDRYAKK